MGLQLSRPLWEVLSNQTIMKQFVAVLLLRLMPILTTQLATLGELEFLATVVPSVLPLPLLWLPRGLPLPPTARPPMTPSPPSSATLSLNSSATRRSPPSSTPPRLRTARTSPSRSAPSPLSVLPIPQTLSDTLPVLPALLLSVVLAMVPV